MCRGNDLKALMAVEIAAIQFYIDSKGSEKK